MRSSLALPALVLVSVLVEGGCDPTVPPAPTDIGPRDAAPRDTPVDVPSMDAPLADGEVPDVFIPSDGGMRTCSVSDADRLELATDIRMRERLVGLAAGPSSWAATWYATVDGLDEIFVASIPAEGEAVVRQHTSLVAIQRDPAIVHTSRGWLLAWVGNHLGSNYEIYAQGLAEDVTAMGTATRLTTNTDADQTPTLIALPTSGVLAAWVQVAGMTDNLAFTRVLSETGAATAAARMVTTMDSSVERPTLGYRSAGAVLGWGESRATPPAARVLALDAVGGPSGLPADASTEGNIDGSADLTMDAFGGAMVFGALIAGVRPEVRFRLLDETGTPAESERAPIPSSGRDASIAAFGGSWVVAYRAIGATSSIRLAFLDPAGVFLGEIELSPAEGMGGRTTVRVTEDGRIAVVWADSTAMLTRVRAVRVRCE